MPLIYPLVVHWLKSVGLLCSGQILEGIEEMNAGIAFSISRTMSHVLSVLSRCKTKNVSDTSSIIGSSFYVRRRSRPRYSPVNKNLVGKSDETRGGQSLEGITKIDSALL